MKKEELLRELVDNVGKRGQAGQDLQNVMSVAMLSEGWDAKNVTHIMGLRAFTSQLLCEQVIGRGLRRVSYDMDDERAVPARVRERLRRAAVDLPGARRGRCEPATAAKTSTQIESLSAAQRSTRSSGPTSCAWTMSCARSSWSSGARWRVLAIDPATVAHARRHRARAGRCGRLEPGQDHRPGNAARRVPSAAAGLQGGAAGRSRRCRSSSRGSASTCCSSWSGWWSSSWRRTRSTFPRCSTRTRYASAS